MGPAHWGLALAEAPKRLGPFYRALARRGWDADAREVADLLIEMSPDRAYPALVDAALAAGRLDLAVQLAAEGGVRHALSGPAVPPKRP